MEELSRILDTACIKLDLYSKKKKDAIKEMVNLLREAGRIDDPEKLAQAIFQREKLGSTGIGEGIAIPHVMIKEVTETILAFGRKREGLKYDSLDHLPVKLIFLMVGPPGHEIAHLKYLSKLSRFLSNDNFKEALMKAESREELFNIILQEEKKE